VSYHQPTGYELGEWMANDAVLDEKVKGTEFERTLTNDSPNQRSGIISTVNVAGPAFRLLPDEAKRTFSTKEWAKTRRGWIFITNTTGTRDALYPLQSMWVDLLIARLLDIGQPKGLPFTWLFLDELAAFQHLPKLKLGITEGRKAGLSIFLGFHGKSQIEGIYGKDADTLFSLPRTKIFLRTAEEGAAKWASGMIGEVEMMRVRESRPAHEFFSQGRGHNYSVERTIEPLVLYSTIMRLPDLEGYLCYENMVVPIRLAVIPKTVIAPKYIPAPIRQRWFAADQDAAEPSESITPQQKKAAVEHEECPPDDFPDEEPEDGDPEQKSSREPRFWDGALSDGTCFQSTHREQSAELFP
jgi:type IV secretory pathway TraG/TraD family ATPase VirD4